MPIRVLDASVYHDNIQAMIEFERIEGFEWDAGNALKSVSKHGVTQAEAEQIFFNAPLTVGSDAQHSRAELRYHALGHTHAGRLLHITFTLRLHNTRIRVISARAMHRKERAIYEKEA